MMMMMMPVSCDSLPPPPAACTAGVMGLVARVAPLPRVAPYRACCGWAWLGLVEGRGGGRAWLRGGGAAGPGWASLYCSSCVLVLRCHCLARSRGFTVAGRQRSSEWQLDCVYRTIPPASKSSFQTAALHPPPPSPSHHTHLARSKSSASAAAGVGAASLLFQPQVW